MLVLLTALPAIADARVAIVATQTDRAAVLDVSTNTVVGRPALGVPTSHVAVARSGRRGFVAGANVVAALDIATVRAGVRAQPRQSGGAIADPGALTPPPAEVTIAARVTLPAPVAGIAVSPAGGRVYAAAGRWLYVLDARSLRRLGRARLGGRATALALSRLGSYAAVALAGRRVAIVATAGPKLRRRVKAGGVTGLAWDLAGRLWVVSRGRVAVLPADARKLAKRRVRLPRGAGGGRGGVARRRDAGDRRSARGTHGGARERHDTARARAARRRRAGHAGLVARRRADLLRRRRCRHAVAGLAVRGAADRQRRARGRARPRASSSSPVWPGLRGPTARDTISGTAAARPDRGPRRRRPHRRRPRERPAARRRGQRHACRRQLRRPPRRRAR